MTFFEQPVEQTGAAAYDTEGRLHVKSTWLWMPATIILVLVLGMIVVWGGEHMPGMLLAYLNGLIILGTVYYFMRQGTLHATVPVFFLGLVGLSWPAATIYFGIVEPDAVYGTMHGFHYFLEGAIRLQCVLLVFLVCYVSTVLLTIRRPPSAGVAFPPRRESRRFTTVIVCITLLMLGFNALSKVVPLPGLLAYLADGGFLYANGMLLVVGALISEIPRRTVIVTVSLLLLFGFFYTLGNARGMAMLPFALFVFGFLFIGRASQKAKVTVLLTLLFVTPVYVVIGDSTRVLMKSIGFEGQDIGARWEALKSWREARGDQRVMSGFFDRLFFTGGHSIVTMSPEQVNFMEFSPGTYLEEAGINLLPQILYYRPHYSTTFVLLDYDINVSESTSVEVSLVGSLWMLGGWLPIVIGAVVTGLMQAWIARVIRKAGERSMLKGLYMTAMMGPTVLWMANMDLISNFRSTVWHVVLGLLFYHVAVMPLCGMLRYGSTVIGEPWHSDPVPGGFRA